MYNNSYEDYIRNFLGINIMPAINENTTNQICHEDDYNIRCNEKAESMYPDIYKLVYPLVYKRCIDNNEEISEELVSKITNEIYMNIEEDEIKQEQTKIMNNKAVIQNNGRINQISSNISDKRINNKSYNNCTLKDLIRILVIRELIKNTCKNRPPMKLPFVGPNQISPNERPTYKF